VKFLLLAALLGISCVVTPPPPPPPVPPGDPTCGTACARLQALSCPEGGNTPAGASCLNVCWDTENNGLKLPLACLTNAASCDAAESCQ
jgi:hypothetical protein